MGVLFIREILAYDSGAEKMIKIFQNILKCLSDCAARPTEGHHLNKEQASRAPTPWHEPAMALARWCAWRDAICNHM
jgi:hypothetical protein